MNNNNNNNLYNSVWNNNYIKRIIFKYLNKFNILNLNICFETLEDFKFFENKEFLKSVTMKFEIDIDQLPLYIKHVRLPFNSPKNILEIPNHIESICFNRLSEVDLGSFISNSNWSSKIKELKLSLNSKYNYYQFAIPPSVTNLNVSFSDGKMKISSDMLPKELKVLKVKGFSGDSSIVNITGLFPSSLREAAFFHTHPSIVNQLSYGLTKLSLHSNTSVIDDSITFPDSIQKLHIRCELFKSIKWPKDLKEFELLLSMHTDKIIFPQSLEKLSIIMIKRLPTVEEFFDYQQLPPNLKELNLPCASILDTHGKSILLNSNLEKLSIAYLDILFTKALDTNLFPSTLTEIDFGPTFDSEIKFGVLPNQLKRVIFGFRFNRTINSNVLPPGLEYLEVPNPFYNFTIDMSSHPNTIVSVCSKIGIFYNPIRDINIKVLRLPDSYSYPFSFLGLKDKSNLEYLHLGTYFNQDIQLSDLPVQNNIKILETSSTYNQILNLDYFPNLETLIINSYLDLKNSKDYQHNCPMIISTQDSKLKQILVNPNFNNFIKRLDYSFYPLLKYKSNNKLNK